MPASPVAQVGPGASLRRQEVDTTLGNLIITSHHPHALPTPTSSHTHPAPHHQVLWILPSEFVSSMSLPLHPHCHFLCSGFIFSRWTVTSLLRVSQPPPCLQSGLSPHKHNMIFFDITNLSVLKTLQCFPHYL